MPTIINSWTQNTEYIVRFNELLSSFFSEPTINIFKNLIVDTRSFVAGSSALWAVRPWIVSCSVSKSFDGDLDIWVPINFFNEEKRNGITSKWKFLIENVAGYTEVVTRSDDESYISRYSPLSGIIHNIKNYVHPDTGRRVQLIYIMTNKDGVLKSFDLTFCAIAWTSSNWVRDMFYFRYNEVDVLAGRGYIANVITNKTERNEKYKARGFTILMDQS